MYRTRRSIAIAAVQSTPDNRTPKLVTKAVEKTPKTPQTISETPKSQLLDPVMARINRDLNSPSAAARIRATRALKSSTLKKAIYQQFDVCHDTQDIITTEERNATVSRPKTIRETFSECKIYVEVRTGCDNRSEGIKMRLLRDGICVNEKLYKDTTHVIFKDGLLSTFKSAKKLGIPVTTILWIDACIAQKRLLECDRFPISNLERYEHPELFKRLRREKSMQPNITKSVGKQFKPDLKPTLDRSFSQDDTRDDPKSHETILENEGMELTLQNNKTSSMDIELDKWKENIRRFTTFTPNPMEQTSLNRRKTLFTPQVTQSSNESISTPDTNSGKTIVFNSSNRIGKMSRRSIFDISMNIFDMNLKSLSQSDNAEPLAKVASARKEQQLYTQEQPKPAQIRKRKLFNNDEVEDEQKENLDNSYGGQKKSKLDRSIVDGWKTPIAVKSKKDVVKRRETFACFKSRDTTVKPKTPVKPAIVQKYIVCTNMSSADKQIVHAAILKLGGKFETEVSSKTTHVVSPNQERTMNILRGVVLSAAIVNVDWVHDSVARGKWLETTMYTHSICDTNRVHERSILGSKVYKNTAFAFCGSFFITKETIENPRKIEYLTEIIQLCGGRVTEKHSDAAIIISDKIKEGFKQPIVISTFIFDSAMKGIFLETAAYRPKQKQ